MCFVGNGRRFIAALAFLSIHATTVTVVNADPKHIPGETRRRELLLSESSSSSRTDEEIERELSLAYQSIFPSNRGIENCQLIKLRFNRNQLKSWGNLGTEPGDRCGTSAPMYTIDDKHLAGYYVEDTTTTPLDNIGCIGKAAYTLGSYDSNIFIEYVCGTKYNPITGGSGKYACATGVETFECESDEFCPDYIYLCGDCKGKNDAAGYGSSNNNIYNGNNNHYSSNSGYNSNNGHNGGYNSNGYNNNNAINSYSNAVHNTNTYNSISYTNHYFIDNDKNNDANKRSGTKISNGGRGNNRYNGRANTRKNGKNW